MTIDTPAWVRDAVFYQVFPDRFAASSRVPKPGTLEPWAAPPTNFGYKGGDLLGLAERLDELVDLGITALYLNPIFTAASNHRYNAYDYRSVDPLLGGDAALRELLDRAHDRGIRVILDGVFNHVGRGYWPFHHVMENGGASPYRDWFYLEEDVLAGRRGIRAYDVPRGAPDAERGYRSWWDVPGLPKLRVEHPPVREHLLDVAEHWLRFGIDGWRLDVPQDVEDPTFWPEFRRRVRAVNPDAYLLGEIWEEAPEWLDGQRFDATMNYPLALAILGFVGGSSLDAAVIAGQSNYARALVELDGTAFGSAINRMHSLYDPDVTAAQYNLLGSHDTPRARSVMGGSPDRLRLATLLQFVLPGAPAIYYGDELAMEGAADPDCRRAFPPAGESLDAEAAATRAFARALIRARRDHVALRRGDVRVVASGPRWILLERLAEGRRALVAANAGDAPASVDLGSVGGADGMHILELPGTASTVAFAAGSISLPPLGGAILVDG
ncbi:MAG TPA: glycoside hydrolase family 13 protein [Candidatus Limnocylindrales bacterium]|nr:glycoside hydrolase family 13 protein [Candidatus Limnocylindrales bacterium]